MGFAPRPIVVSESVTFMIEYSLLHMLIEKDDVAVRIG